MGLDSSKQVSHVDPNWFHWLPTGMQATSYWYLLPAGRYISQIILLPTIPPAELNGLSMQALGKTGGRAYERASRWLGCSGRWPGLANCHLPLCCGWHSTGCNTMYFGTELLENWTGGFHSSFTMHGLPWAASGKWHCRTWVQRSFCVSGSGSGRVDIVRSLSWLCSQSVGNLVSWKLYSD